MDGPVTGRRPHLGRVTAFDAARALGTVTDESGRVLPFHSTAIADGSRRIAEGTAVTYQVEAGHRGRLEARGIRAIALPV